jgi:hypothetical protein
MLSDRFNLAVALGLFPDASLNPESSSLEVINLKRHFQEEDWKCQSGSKNTNVSSSSRVISLSKLSLQLC